MTKVLDSVEITEAQKMKLEYNRPVDVRPNFSAVANPTSQANSILSIENLSTSNILTYFVSGGPLNETGNLPANDATPKLWPVNFKGAKLAVSNISTREANARVTLRST